MKQHHVVDLIAMILLVVGGLNWGLVGLFKFNLVDAIFGDMSALTRIIYVLVGVSALYKVVCWAKAKAK
ncbi:MAG: DUF378 domain-containing protein [Verrucomicrobia bacterium]|nr:DUF378 domain-containing protein [Verrucomicrobiota bacterium]